MALFGNIVLLLHPHVDVSSLAVVGEPGKRHARRSNKAQVDSDWLNPKSLRIMSTSSYIENIA